MSSRKLTDQKKTEAFDKNMAQRQVSKMNHQKHSQLNANIIKMRLEKILFSKETFCIRVKEYFKDNYFQFLYQNYQRNITYILSNKKHKDINQWKKLFSDNHLLELLNDIYRTRLSKKGIDELKGKIIQHNDWNDYDATLKLFEGIIQVEKADDRGSPVEMRKNAFSLGTKVLHTFDPDHNPIIDNVILTTLDLKGQMGKDGIPFCLQLRNAFNTFAHENQDYFNLSSELECYLQSINIDIDIPTMKMLDIALYKKPEEN